MEQKKELKPKVNSHNEITIHPIKDSWNREGVISFGRYILQASNQVIKESSKLKPLNKETGEKLLKDLFDEWIKENL